MRIRWDSCLVVIQIGVNDASAGVAPEAFKSQLEELIGKLQKSGAQVIQCTCTCRVEGYNASDGFDKKLDALAEAARAVAREKKLPLVDLRSAFIELRSTQSVGMARTAAEYPLVCSSRCPREA